MRAVFSFKGGGDPRMRAFISLLSARSLAPLCKAAKKLKIFFSLSVKARYPPLATMSADRVFSVIPFEMASEYVKRMMATGTESELFYHVTTTMFAFILLFIMYTGVIYVTLRVSSKELVWLFLVIEFILMHIWNMNILANLTHCEHVGSKV